MTAAVDFDRLWPAAAARFRLGPRSIHGLAHWRRVEANGVTLAAANDADVTIVRAFAALHDSCLENEHHDPQHGPRAAEWARTLRGSLLHFSNADFETLTAALIGHDRSETSADATIGACWDADRLDLWRVGIVPHPKFMSTALGRRMAAGINGKSPAARGDETLG